MRTARSCLLVAALVAAGCPKQAPTEEHGAPVTVDATGGTVSGPAGASVTVPPGATAAAVNIAITRRPVDAPALPEEAAAGGDVFAITPHGATFDHPVTVRIPFDATGQPADAVLGLAKISPGGRWTIYLGLRVDGAFIEQPVKDFSFFAPVFLPGSSSATLPTFRLDMALDHPEIYTDTQRPGPPPGGQPTVSHTIQIERPMSVTGTLTIPFLPSWCVNPGTPHLDLFGGHEASFPTDASPATNLVSHFSVPLIQHAAGHQTIVASFECDPAPKQQFPQACPFHMLCRYATCIPQPNDGWGPCKCTHVGPGTQAYDWTCLTIPPAFDPNRRTLYVLESPDRIEVDYVGRWDALGFLNVSTGPTALVEGDAVVAGATVVGGTTALGLEPSALSGVVEPPDHVRAALQKSTDGGDTWTPVDTLAEENIHNGDYLLLEDWLPGSTSYQDSWHGHHFNWTKPLGFFSYPSQTLVDLVPPGLAYSFSGASLASASTSLRVVALTDSGSLWRIQATYTNPTTHLFDAATSDAWSITVARASVPPAFTSQPQSVQATAPGSASFNVAVGGWPVPTLQWQKAPPTGSSWVDVPGATNTTLAWDPALTDDGWRVRAVARNASGQAVSTVAVLHVTAAPIPPIIRQQPVSVIGVAGSLVTFSALADGTDPKGYQWLRDGVPILLADNASARSTFLVLHPSLADDGSLYRVRVTNVAGSVDSQDAQLSVIGGATPVAPAIGTQPVSLTVPAGDAATFAVVATGSPLPSFRWSRGGLALADGPNLTGTRSAVLTILAVSAGDAGSYAVQVTSPAGGPLTSSPATLTVLPSAAPTAPLIVGPPTSLTVVPGGTATLAVAATGTGPLVYQWSRDGVALADDAHRSGSMGPVLTIVGVNGADAGAYTVTVHNSVNPPATSVPATLTVIGAPAIATQPASVAVNAGQAATFTVSATGTAPLSYQWMRNGVAIAGATGASYTTPATVTADSGAIFSVVVFNPAGDAISAGAVLTVVVPPPLAIASVTPPNASAANPASTTTVQANFSAPLDCPKTTAASLQVFEATVQVPGTVGCAGSTLTFLPSPALPTATSLVGHVDAAVKSLAGGTLGAAYGWSFGMGPWTRQLGSAAFDQANAVVTDHAGNVFVVGSTQGSLDGNTLGGLYDLFAAKYAPSGAKLWTRQLGGATGEITLGLGAATDAAGNLYVVGMTFANLDGKVNAGSSDAFIVKYDASGTKQWTKLLGTTLGETAAAAATDAAGNLYVVGWTGGNLDGNTSAGLDDLFVAKFDGAGTKLWTRQAGGIQYDQAKAVAVDGAGNIYVAGTTQGGFDGNLHVGPTTTVDGFLVKYDAAGTKLWTRQFGTVADEWTHGVAADAAGNAYVAGQTSGGLDGNVNAGLAGTFDAFLLKYDATGAKQWTKQFGSAATDGLSAVATDGAGNLFVAGATSGAIEAGSTNTTGLNLFVARFDAAGTRIWLHQRGSGAATSDGAAAVTADAFGGIFAAGLTNGGFDGNANAGSFDAYVVKYQGDGTQR